MAEPIIRRDHYLDTARGVAAIGVIAIHTAFWSGETYGVPMWFRSLTLGIDVGLFFFLAGWAFSLKEKTPWKVFKGIGGLWLKWIYFISIIGFLLIYHEGGIADLADLISNYVFKVSIPKLAVISGSIWFMPVYIVIVLINSVVIYAINLTSQNNKQKYKNYFRYFIFLLFLSIFQLGGMELFPRIEYQYIFYSTFFGVGLVYGKKRFEVKHKVFIIGLVALIIGMLLSSKIIGMPINPMQNNKFPPNLIYMFYTFIGIWIVIWGGRYGKKFKKNILSHVGKNAIWYYFAQGVGSSLIYFVKDMNIILTEEWYIKWVILFIINIFITVLIAEIFSATFSMLNKFVCTAFYKYKNKFIFTDIE